VSRTLVAQACRDRSQRRWAGRSSGLEVTVRLGASDRATRNTICAEQWWGLHGEAASVRWADTIGSRFWMRFWARISHANSILLFDPDLTEDYPTRKEAVRAGRTHPSEQLLGAPQNRHEANARALAVGRDNSMKQARLRVRSRDRIEGSPRAVKPGPHPRSIAIMGQIPIQGLQSAPFRAALHRVAGKSRPRQVMLSVWVAEGFDREPGVTRGHLNDHNHLGVGRRPAHPGNGRESEGGCASSAARSLIWSPALRVERL